MSDPVDISHLTEDEQYELFVACLMTPKEIDGRPATHADVQARLPMARGAIIKARAHNAARKAGPT
jgi:hypothetical protein